MGQGAGQPSLGEIRFTLPGGRERTAREVRQALYTQRLTLSDGQRGTFKVTCLIAREIAPPPGVKLIEWGQLTNPKFQRAFSESYR